MRSPNVYRLTDHYIVSNYSTIFVYYALYIPLIENNGRKISTKMNTMVIFRSLNRISLPLEISLYILFSLFFFRFGIHRSLAVRQTPIVKLQLFVSSVVSSATAFLVVLVAQWRTTKA